MLRDFMLHMEWADARVWDAVLAQGGNDARLHRLLYHLHATQHAFLEVWRTGSFVNDVPEDHFPDLASIREWSRPYYAAAMQVLESEKEDRIVRLPWADAYMKRFGRTAAATTFAETVIQVTSHSTYHRGQIAARLRERGAEPPLVDYIAWLWLARDSE
ncbi:MAG TPA: DinB family protein [Thermoanaerobaculia bacterium]|nr:DinB family protein [Thermoanaerobaculia bacterium]